MCEPTTIMLAISVASAVASYAQQADAARKQEHAAQDNWNAQQAQLKEHQIEVNQGAAQKESDRAKAAMIERGRLRVASGEAGVYGNSPDAQLHESIFNAGSDITTIENNRKNNILASEFDGNAAQARNQGIINTSQRPSALGAGLQIASSYYGTKQPSPTSTTTTTSGAEKLAYQG